jgi:hypothetical protein
MYFFMIGLFGLFCTDCSAEGQIIRRSTAGKQYLGKKPRSEPLGQAEYIEDQG